MDHKPDLRIVLLGGFEVRVGDRSVEPSASRLSKARDVHSGLVEELLDGPEPSQVPVGRLWGERR